MQKVLFIVNPIAGHRDKKSVIDIIRKNLNDIKYDPEFVLTTHPGHATELARETDAEIVVAVGGDGTVSEVAGGIAGTPKILGVIPCGSGDGLAFHLGIRRQVAEAVEVLNLGLTVAMDYAEVCGKPFFCTVGMGFDALVSYEFAMSESRGLKTYIYDALKIWREFKSEYYEICSDDVNWSGEASMITVANANQWGNRAKIAPLASVTDGLLDVIVIKPFKDADIPELAYRLMHGTLDHSHFVETFRVSEVKIIRAHPGPVHYDGEPFEMGNEIKVKVIPKALKVIIPFDKYKTI